MIPLQVLLIPRFILLANLGWINTYWGVIGPHMADAFGLFFARQFMLDIPDELLEAARLDGASELTIFRKVVIPLTWPAIAVLVILGFSGRWNAFAWPLVALTRKEMYTVQLGINFMKGYYATDYPALIAMVVVSLIPIIVVFLTFQKYFIQGIARTGIK
jgi:multiple sugar transport system permease protein/alpha-1,4-digalacturonate transport system permease protein